MIAPTAIRETYSEYYMNGRYLTCTYIAFQACEECKGSGRVSVRASGSGSIYTQCLACLKQNEVWKRTHPIFYRITSLAAYTLTSINRYNEEVTEHFPAKIVVYGYAIIDDKHEMLIMDYLGDWRRWSYKKEFKKREAAQAWIAEQQGGDISRFWIGL